MQPVTLPGWHRDDYMLGERFAYLWHGVLPVPPPEMLGTQPNIVDDSPESLVSNLQITAAEQQSSSIAAAVSRSGMLSRLYAVCILRTVTHSMGLG